MRFQENRGSAFIVAFGVVVLMMSLGITFLFHTKSESKATQNKHDQIRARFLASSGLEKALGAEVYDLAMGTEPLYHGEDWYETGDNTTIPKNNKTVDWNGNENGVLDVRGLPVDQALNPSMPVEGENGNPKLIELRNTEEETVKARGISGELPSSPPDASDTYTLKMIDNSTRINLNSENRNLADIINRLFRHKQNFRVKKKVEGTKAPGDEILQLRSKLGGKFTKLEQLKRVLKDDIYFFLAPHLVLDKHTWVNPSVIQPKPQPVRTVNLPGGGGVNGGGKFRPGNGPKKFDFQFKIQPRAPVNVNRAPVFVLSSLVAGLEAQALKTNLYNRKTSANQYPNLTATKIGPITDREAQIAARKMVKYREGNCSVQLRGKEESGPFETWREFDAFVDQAIIQSEQCAVGEETDFGKSAGYLLKAHFNPHTRYDKNNPNATARLSWRKQTPDGPVQLFLDKTDFTYHTTEFTFFATGYFEVRSLGRVVDADKTLSASALVKSVIRPYRVAQHKSQRDFLVNGPASTSGEYPGKVEGNAEQFITYPENAKILPAREQIVKGAMNTPRAAGNLSTAPHYYRPLMSSPSDTLLDDLDEEFKNGSPGKVTKDYFTATAPKGGPGSSGESGFRNVGVTGGKFEEDKVQQFPMEDPRSFSDSPPDGALLTSARHRYYRISADDVFNVARNRPTTNPYWWMNGGAVSIWWKPKHDIPSSSDRDNVELEIFNGWFLSENIEVKVPIFENAFLGTFKGSSRKLLHPTIGDPDTNKEGGDDSGDDSGDGNGNNGDNSNDNGGSNDNTGDNSDDGSDNSNDSGGDQGQGDSGEEDSEGGSEGIDTTDCNTGSQTEDNLRTKVCASMELPKYLKKQFGHEVKFADAAGYRVRLFYSTNPEPGYYMEVSFELFPGRISPSHSLPTDKNPEGSDQLLAAKVQTKLPINARNREQVAPESGKWNHVVLKWEPREFSLRYLEDNGKVVEEGRKFQGGLQTEKKDVKVLTGSFWINGVSSRPIEEHNKDDHIWAAQVPEDSKFLKPDPTQPGKSIQPPESIMHMSPEVLRLYNLVLTSKIKKPSKGDGDSEEEETTGELLYDPEHIPGQIMVREANPVEEFSNVIWFGSSTHPGHTPNTPIQNYFMEGTLGIWTLSTTPKVVPPEPVMRPFDYEEMGRYPKLGTSKAVFRGNFFREEQHPYANRSDAAPVPPSKMLQGDGDKPVEILLLSHTQYLPTFSNRRGSYTGGGNSPNGTPDSSPGNGTEEQPYFFIKFGIGSDSGYVPSKRWFGAPVKPEELFQDPLVLSTDNDKLNYTLYSRNMNHTPQNTTPFFEGITVLYETKKQTEILSLQYAR